MRIPGSGSAPAPGAALHSHTSGSSPRAPPRVRPGQTSKQHLHFQGQEPGLAELEKPLGQVRACCEGTLQERGRDTLPWGQGMLAGDRGDELGRDRSHTTDLQQQEVPVLPSQYWAPPRTILTPKAGEDPGTLLTAPQP